MAGIVKQTSDEDKDQVPDSARNMLEPDPFNNQPVDSTTGAFNLDDGTQDAINMDYLEDDKSAKDDTIHKIKKMKSEIVFDDEANKLQTNHGSNLN